jgi:hypothetical protein
MAEQPGDLVSNINKVPQEARLIRSRNASGNLMGTNDLEISYDQIDNGTLIPKNLSDGTYVLKKTGTNVTFENAYNFIEDNGGGGGGNINVNYQDSGTWSALLNMKQNGALTPGKKYLMTDYQTIYIQPVSNAIKTDTPIEPLVLTALSSSHFEPIVYSTTRPKDVIYYTIENEQKYNWCSAQYSKGVITRRIDANNNDCPYDHIAIKFIRYNFNLSAITEFPNNGTWSYNFMKYNSFLYKRTNYYNNNNILPNLNYVESPFTVNQRYWQPYLSLINVKDINNNNNNNNKYLYYFCYDNYNNTPLNEITEQYINNTDYVELYTFSVISEMEKSGLEIVKIISEESSNIKVYNNYMGPCFSQNYNYYVLPNNVFFHCKYLNYNTENFACYDNKFGIRFNNNTLGNNITNNIFDYDCNDNIILGNFNNNVIGNNFQYNIINNYYQESLSSTISINFSNNKILNYCTSNVFNGFSFNNIENYFEQNIIGRIFKINNIKNNFQNNNIGDYFGNNNISNDFQNNIVFNFFNNNVVGIMCDTNLFSYNFNNNIIHNNFNSNAFKRITNSINNNVFGDSFFSNIFDINLEYNNFGIYFNSNTFIYTGILFSYTNFPIYCRYLKNIDLSNYENTTYTYYLYFNYTTSQLLAKRLDNSSILVLATQ